MAKKTKQKDDRFLVELIHRSFMSADPATGAIVSRREYRWRIVWTNQQCGGTMHEYHHNKAYVIRRMVKLWPDPKVARLVERDKNTWAWLDIRPPTKQKG